MRYLAFLILSLYFVHEFRAELNVLRIEERVDNVIGENNAHL